MLMSTELICQWINTAAFVVPNAALLARPCHYFSLIIRKPFWTFQYCYPWTSHFMSLSQIPSAPHSVYQIVVIS